MRTCNLTDEQLRVHVANHRKIERWATGDSKVSATMGGIADAIEELLDRRATDGPVDRVLERSFAFERASGVIESHCSDFDVRDGPGEDDGWYNLTTSAMDLSQEIDYLDARGLLEHHPDRPHLVQIRDEDEPGEPQIGAVALGGVEDLLLGNRD